MAATAVAASSNFSVAAQAHLPAADSRSEEVFTHTLAWKKEDEPGGKKA